MSYTPDKGDIVWFDFDPSAGSEIMKRRPAFVVSRKAFNAHTGFALVAPITSVARGMKLEVVLEGIATEGSVLIHQLKSLDFASRKVAFIERAPEAVTRRVTQLAVAIVQ